MNEVVLATPDTIREILGHFKQEMIQEFKNILAAEKTIEEPDEAWDAQQVADYYGVSLSTVNRKKPFFGAYNVGRSVKYSSRFIKQLKEKNKFRK